MKKLIIILVSISTIIFSACEGDPGPPGPPGIDGGLIVSGAFEKVVQFTPGNDFQDIEPYGFDVFPSDVTLVYILWETSGGEDIWRLLPQSVEFDEGTLVYNFDFTQQDVRFFLDGTIDPNLLGPEWTQDQVFRVVVVPADNVDSIDISNLNTVMEVNGIESFEVK